MITTTTTSLNHSKLASSLSCDAVERNCSIAVQNTLPSSTPFSNAACMVAVHAAESLQPSHTANAMLQEWIKLLHSVSHVSEVIELHVDAPEGSGTAACSTHAPSAPASGAAVATGAELLLPDQGPPGASRDAVIAQHAARQSGAESATPTELTGLQWVLTALDSACMHLRHLRVLDFNRLAIYAQHLHLLGRVFHSMSCSLEELRIWGFEDWEQDVPAAVRCSYTPETKALFFRTVSMLQNLRTLSLPVWKGFVGNDSDAALALLDLKTLEAVYVSEIDYSVVVAYDLHFHVIQKDLYSAESPTYHSMSPRQL